MTLLTINASWASATVLLSFLRNKILTAVSELPVTLKYWHMVTTEHRWCKYNFWCVAYGKTAQTWKIILQKVSGNSLSKKVSFLNMQLTCKSWGILPLSYTTNMMAWCFHIFLDIHCYLYGIFLGILDVQGV